MSFWRLLACAALLPASVLSVSALSASPALAQTSASTAPTPATTVATASSAVAPANAASAPSASAPATVVAFDYASLKPGDAAAGQAKIAVCAACHGMDGNPPTSLYPRLAGQSEHYTAEQLSLFKSGARESAIMGVFAAPLSGQDMRDIGAFFSTQEPLAGVADEALVDAGRTLYRQGDATRDIPACMACHGPAGLGNPGAPYAHLAGQYADYVQTTLHAWKDGAVWGSDAHANIMPTISKRLSDEDIAALASYIEGLHAAGADAE